MRLASPPVDISSPVPIAPLSVVDLPSSRKKLDRAIADKRLALQVVEDLPVFYSRLKQVALEGTDKDAVSSITYLLDRLLGKIPAAVTEVNTQINIQNNNLLSPEDLRERISRLRLVAEQ